MPLPDGSMALVPAGAQSSQEPGFAQKGSVDWVALGQTQFSASIAILGRLSSAGIEPLTITVGQVICSKVPLVVHGEGVLNNAMANLQAFSSFGGAIWFGVRYPSEYSFKLLRVRRSWLYVRDRAKATTNQLLLLPYTRVKRFGSPRDLTPGFSQREALIKVCSSVFCQSTLGLRINQLLILGKYTGDALSGPLPGHPQDLAEVRQTLYPLSSLDRVFAYSMSRASS